MINRLFRLKLSVVLNLIIRVLSTILSFFLVYFLLQYLGNTKYGVWATISSILTWFNFFDIGLGQGLKLLLTQSFSRKKIRFSTKLISTAYFLSISISILLFLIFVFFTSFLDWNQILGVSDISPKELSSSINILFFLFFVVFSLKLIGVIYSSLQLPFVDNIIRILAQIIFLVSIAVIIQFKIPSNLIVVSVASLLPMVAIYLVFSFYIFKIKAPSLFPKIRNVHTQTIKKLTSPSIDFFIIQIGCVILYSTDNFIILKMLSASDVTEYSVLYKLYSAPFIFFNLYISTHGSFFIEAISTKQYDWIKTKVIFFKRLFISLIFIYFLLFYFENSFLEIWLPDFNYNKSDLSFYLIVYFLLSSLTTIYVYVINSFGKLKIQLFSYLIISAINIPLSIYLLENLDYGVSGVIIASAVCISILLIMMPIQYYRLINHKSSGVWNK